MEGAIAENPSCVDPVARHSRHRRGAVALVLDLAVDEVEELGVVVAVRRSLIADFGFDKHAGVTVGWPRTLARALPSWHQGIHWARLARDDISAVQ